MAMRFNINKQRDFAAEVNILNWSGFSQKQILNSLDPVKNKIWFNATQNTSQISFISKKKMHSTEKLGIYQEIIIDSDDNMA